jgi:hypothetical protein
MDPCKLDLPVTNLHSPLSLQSSGLLFTPERSLQLRDLASSKPSPGELVLLEDCLDAHNAERHATESLDGGPPSGSFYAGYALPGA